MKMAYYDLVTGKIFGAKKGSLHYYHEVGHKIFNSSLSTIKIAFIREQLPIYCLGVLCFCLLFLNNIVIKTALNITAILIFVTYLALYEYEEVWCWFYAFKKKKVI